MKRTAAFAMTLVLASAALAADFTMRPGRWEVTLEMKFPQEMPEGMPLSEPMKAIDCVTEAISIQSKLAEPPGEDCKMSNYRDGSDSVQFTLQCDDVAVDYRIVRHSADSFSATGISHGKDPNQRITIKSSARRTGAACSAKELADSRADED